MAEETLMKYFLKDIESTCYQQILLGGIQVQWKSNWTISKECFWSFVFTCQHCYEKDSRLLPPLRMLFIWVNQSSIRVGFETNKLAPSNLLFLMSSSLLEVVTITTGIFLWTGCSFNCIRHWKPSTLGMWRSRKIMSKGEGPSTIYRASAPFFAILQCIVGWSSVNASQKKNWSSTSSSTKSIRLMVCIKKLN